MRKAVLMLLSSVGFVALQAHAHTYLSESAPADESIVDIAPQEIVLGFSEAVTLTAISIRAADGAERALEFPRANEKRFTVSVSDLRPGEYVVSWRAIGADTHIVSGEFRFTIADA